MERVHLHTIQQIQLEHADGKKRSGTYPDDFRVSQTSSNDASQFVLNNGNQLDENGNVEIISSYVSTGNAKVQVEHVLASSCRPPLKIVLQSANSVMLF